MTCHMYKSIDCKIRQKKRQATLVGGAVQGDHLVVKLLSTVFRQQPVLLHNSTDHIIFNFNMQQQNIVYM